MSIFQLLNRAEIRASIVRAIGGIAGTATGGGDTSSLIDTYALQGADDEHIGKGVYMTKVAGVAATSKTWVSDFAGSTSDATLSPVLGGNVAAGDTYEMYPRPFNVDDINDSINRAISAVSAHALLDRVTDGQFTQSGIYEYDWLTPYAFGADFRALYKVEYCSSIGVDHLLSDCETAWTAGGSVTATADASFERMGTYCAKLVVASGAAAAAVLGYIDITALDISDCDRVEFDMYSSIALTAGYLDLVLDDTAACVSPVESIDIPAMDAGRWYRHSLTLANPHSDTAIISLGVVNTTDVGACTLYFDNIRAVKDGSKVWRKLNREYWSIMRGDTPKLTLTYTGLSIVGDNTQVRLSGYCAPDIFSDDSTDSEVDPEFIIESVLADIMLNNAKSRALDIDNRADLGKLHLMNAAAKKREITITPRAGTVFV